MKRPNRIAGQSGHCASFRSRLSLLLANFLSGCVNRFFYIACVENASNRPILEAFHRLLFAFTEDTYAALPQRLRCRTMPHLQVAPAKLNLFLELHGTRPDGFHEIETFAVPIDYCDTIEFEPDGGNAIHLRILKDVHFDETEIIPDGEANSVCKAIRFMQRRYLETGLGGQVTLHKQIPSQAGLGGGTSDAAAMVLLIDSAWNLNIPRSELASASAELGSDVPLFIHSRPVVCRGRGELTEPIDALPPLHFAVLVPKFRLSTAVVFRQHDLMEHTPPIRVKSILEAARTGDVEKIAALLFNRLETAAFALCPELENVRKTMEQLGPLAVRMSGSGTTLFALCRNRKEAEIIAGQLKERNLGVAFAAVGGNLF